MCEVLRFHPKVLLLGYLTVAYPTPYDESDNESYSTEIEVKL